MTQKNDDLTANYVGAFDGRLSFGKRPALLIVDFVMAYLDPASPLYAGVEDALASNERLLAAARAAGIPVIFTNVVYQADGADGGLFYKKIPSLRVFLEGSPLGAFPPSLQPADGERVISKQFASAFFGTSLAETLSEEGIDTLLITGLSTSGCVRATALDALQSGFAPFVVREACGDRHPAPHEANLFDLQAKYAEVVSEHEACALLGANEAP
ncbi:MAG: isochorismatase [Sphingomonadales bacterium 35-56-22]|jgi:maleamate amidohydrolase|uniref:isochorismatase family protein n=1 Tax=Sphingorhabdus sp. TaxID=1902408 RepID=UPI000BCFF2AE|nr:isochorismatase family protein [Sphingorhabdus sp.]OYY15017.1 MAG: isochorismatase [Sphingomonadales bacterium 35-56-22]OYY96608.1 MAG: isochorismatase [Sphingomonadales bacterium 28-56-43]OYZ59987.1 MAG: isochorismatase [Sphingomonadales bacterium 24-56-14]OZA82164.1 MAG: isochorismatase [Sphingomonadales bacterium 39-57-19]HQS13371.1 isochorismatase family protein [Sphingorhabdus sp.]